MIIRDGLSKRYNYLFKLIYEEGLDFLEIAEIMGLKLNAVYQLKFRMIKNIIKKAKQKNLYHEPEIFMISPSF